MTTGLTMRLTNHWQTTPQNLTKMIASQTLLMQMKASQTLLMQMKASQTMMR